MRLCLWEKGINTLKFFPRTYYINDISEMLDFLEDYKYTQVRNLNLLKISQAQAVLNKYIKMKDDNEPMT